MTKYQTNLTAVSLFAGVGGFDLAMERNGINVVASVEIDKHAAGILAKRFPNSTILNDVQKVSGNELRSAGFIPDRGILTGGFPCQDLSVAGKRAGLAGARSGLYWEIVRIIEETGPEWVVLENVPGLLSSNNGNDFGVVIGALVDRGYGVSWRVLDAQHFGVPQRRRRVFIVARRAGDTTSAAKVLFERTSMRGNPSTSRTPGQEATGDAGQGAESAGTLTAAGIRCDLNRATNGHLTVEPVYSIEPGAAQRTNSDRYWEEISPTLRANAGDNQVAAGPVTLYEPHHGDGRTTTDRANTLNARMGTGGNNLPVLVEPEVFVKAKRAQNDQDDETWKADAPHPTLNQFDQGDSPTVTAIVETEVFPINTLTLGGRPDPVNDARMTLGVGGNGDPQFTISANHPHAVAKVEPIGFSHTQGLSAQPSTTSFPTLRSGGGGHAVSTGTVRRLTPTECERLQGFPDGWTEGQADSHRYKQMGNAVAVPVVEWIMQGIVELMNDQSTEG